VDDGAPGFSFFRVRATAWTSGTANVVIVAGTYPFEPMVSAQIKYVSVTLYAVTVAVAGTVEFEIVTLSATTAPATGAPAITPSRADQADAAAEATCLALPGTQGSVVNADQPLGDLFVGSYGITGAGATYGATGHTGQVHAVGLAQR
jgi:hypothetical protein